MLIEIFLQSELIEESIFEVESLPLQEGLESPLDPLRHEIATNYPYSLGSFSFKFTIKCNETLVNLDMFRPEEAFLYFQPVLLAFLPFCLSFLPKKLPLFQGKDEFLPSLVVHLFSERLCLNDLLLEQQLHKFSLFTFIRFEVRDHVQISIDDALRSLFRISTNERAPVLPPHQLSPPVLDLLFDKMITKSSLRTFSLKSLKRL
jgi:hypothetical protein